MSRTEGVWILEDKDDGRWEDGRWVMVIVVLLCRYEYRLEVTALSRPPFRKHRHGHAGGQAILVGIEFVRGNKDWKGKTRALREVKPSVHSGCR